MTRKSLEVMLERIEPHPSPRVDLEQYTIPSYLAATILWIAEFKHGDLLGRTVCDLGCGSGRLAIGSVIMGARRAIGVDIDPVALNTARSNARRLGVEGYVDWILADVRNIEISADVVIQNPPFGVQPTLRGIDSVFLVKALKIARDVVYSLHKAGRNNRAFLGKLIRENGGEVTEIVEMEFDIPPIYEFHLKKHYVIKVDLYRVKVGK